MDESPWMTVPASFEALFRGPAGGRLKESAHFIAERHDFCEDLAQTLLLQTRALVQDLGVTVDDVLPRLQAGLANPDSGLAEEETGWVLRRLQELLGRDGE